MRKKKNNPGKLNVAVLISTLITAALTGFAMMFLHQEALYETSRGRLFMPLFMGLLFAAFLLITCLIVFAVSKVTLTYRADVITGKTYKNRVWLYLILGFLVMGVTLFGAEYLYETNFRLNSKSPSTGTYVFLIDDSASMIDSDPNDQRYTVVEALLGNKQDSTRFAVYTFSSGAKQLVPMQTVADGFPAYPKPDYGLTYMKDGLETVLEDCVKERWSDQSAISMILITDGGPNDFVSFEQIQPILDQYISNDITLGIVGVKGANNDLMNDMAQYTGGTFTNIDDIAMVQSAVQLVSGSGSNRDLLSENTTGAPAWLYSLIRILAISLAGAIISLTAALCYGNNTVFNLIFWTNTIKSIVAGILMESVFQFTDLDRVIPQLIAWILLGTIIARRGDTDGNIRRSGKDVDLFDDIYSTTKSVST